MSDVTKNKSRQVYVDVVRLCACVLVVCTHVATMEWNNVPVNSVDWFIEDFFSCLGVNSVPLFMMISGALILNNEYQISYKKLLVNKIGKLVVLYYLVLFFYNLIPFIKGWAPLDLYTIKESLIEGVIYETGVYHMWFIPVLLMLYFSTPILKEAFRTKKVCEYYLILYVLIGLLPSTLLLFELPGAVNHFVSHYHQKSSVLLFAGYVGYFVLGHYIHSFMGELTKKRLIAAWILTIAALSFTTLTCFADAINQGTPSSLTNTPLSINGMLNSAGIFVLLKHYGSKIRSEKTTQVLKKLSAYTLGIYLFHPFVMNEFPFIEGMSNVTDNMLLLIVVRITVVTAITLAIAWLLRKIPGLKKLL